MAQTDNIKPLKLTARDVEDLRVIAACLQDGLTRMAEMTYLPRERRFVAVFNRFMWETLDDDAEIRADGTLYNRISSGIHFDGVMSAKLQGIQGDVAYAWLELLTIICDGPEGTEDGAVDQTITLVFAGGGHIRLEVECVDCTLSDMGAPWTTQNLPKHHDPDDDK